MTTPCTDGLTNRKLDVRLTSIDAAYSGARANRSPADDARRTHFRRSSSSSFVECSVTLKGGTISAVSALCAPGHEEAGTNCGAASAGVVRAPVNSLLAFAPHIGIGPSPNRSE